jgi:DNA-binding beta-propeller fold protein YncE
LPIAALAGCIAVASPPADFTKPEGGSSPAGNNGAGIVSNNAAGIFGNNTAAFAGIVRGPAELVAIGSAHFDPGAGVFLGPQPGSQFDPGAGVFLNPNQKGQFDPGAGVFLGPRPDGQFDPGAGVFLAPRALQAVGQVPLGGALVYLTTPAETLFTRDGRVVGTTTGPEGQYHLAAGLVPDDQPIIVNALFAGNRRLVGMAHSKAGTSSVDLDVGSTYALEMLRTEAKADGKTFRNFDLGRMPDLSERARALLSAGLLGLDATRSAIAGAATATPDLVLDRFLDRLVVGRQQQLADDLAAATAARRADLGAWKALLGRPLAPLVTLAGTFGYGLNSAAPQRATDAPAFGVSGVTAAGDSVYLAFRGTHQIAKVLPDGTLTVVSARTAEDPTTTPHPALPATGSLLADVRIPEPVNLVADRLGNLFVTMRNIVGHPRDAVLMVSADAAPKFGLNGLAPGRVYIVAGTGMRRTDMAGVSNPAGMALDDAGNLFVADLDNDRILRVDRQTGALTRVAGRGPTPVWDFSDAEVPAASASLFAPSAVAWRKSGDTEELYILDGYFQRIRVAKAPGGNWASATLATFAGSGQVVQAGTAPVVAGSFAGDGGPALAARFHFSRVDAADWRGNAIPEGGLAIDAGKGHLYVSDTNNRRVRRIDLTTGVITTVVGGGTNSRDGLSRTSRLVRPAGLFVTPDGDLLIADPGANAVRRLVLD